MVGLNEVKSPTAMPLVSGTRAGGRCKMPWKIVGEKDFK